MCLVNDDDGMMTTDGMNELVVDLTSEKLVGESDLLCKPLRLQSSSFIVLSSFKKKSKIGLFK